MNAEIIKVHEQQRIGYPTGLRAEVVEMYRAGVGMKQIALSLHIADMAPKQILEEDLSQLERQEIQASNRRLKHDHHEHMNPVAGSYLRKSWT